MISMEHAVVINRPVEDVFAFVADPLQFPRWNSAVQTVHGTSGEPGGLGSTYSMQRKSMSVALSSSCRYKTMLIFHGRV